MRAQINPLFPEADVDNRVYVFDLVGSAFLHRQVRHIMVVRSFLVGAGLEKLSTISVFMNVSPDTSNTLLEFQVDRKPEYLMTGVSLSCSEIAEVAQSQTFITSFIPYINAPSSQSVLDEHFLTAHTQYHSPSPQYLRFSQKGLTPDTLPHSNLSPELVLGVPLSAGTYKRGAKYVPLLERKRLDHVNVAERCRIWRGSKYSKECKARCLRMTEFN
ncbi:hypothetical protein DEU56DRAFT_912632 [Suillus clintonianus]|uniref:uncharacterized protein n=1 Tax=Suillus clintonianus TaxID=1904413 RepID=UPI001B87D152|nr:uncharacterized protein DEU56DRAFT_912632 [Suillus clintonianus]KAG2138001.1 hypothetical protein DEU56DRAFT_912632 [Suillus clintonianus]